MRQALSLLLGVLLLVLGTISAACDGDDELTVDELTVEEYFQRFDAIDAEVDAKLEALLEVFPFPEGDEGSFSEEDLPLVKDVTAEQPVIVGDALDELERLNPPAAVEDAHDEFVALGRDLEEVLADIATRVEAVESVSDLERVFEEAEATVELAERQFDAACLALSYFASAGGVITKATCVDE